MSDCFSEGISGNCGFECEAFLRGECENAEEALDGATQEQREMLWDLYEVGEKPKMQRDIQKDREIVAAALHYVMWNMDDFLQTTDVDENYTAEVLAELWGLHRTANKAELVNDQPITDMPAECVIFGCGGRVVKQGQFMMCSNCARSYGEA
jgi:hypothetical protein